MSTYMKQLLRASMCFAAAALAINAVRMAEIRSSGEPAFTVVLKETVINKRGQARSASTQTRAVRSDGSTLLKLGASETGSRLIWFPSGIEVMTNDRLRLKSTIRQPSSAPRRDPRAGCTRTDDASNETSWGEETVDLYRAVKVTHGVSDRASATWYALDYGCAMVKSRMDFGTGEASEWRLVTLIPGEPLDSLFAIPPDYQEGPPSALAGPLDVGKCGSQCQEDLKRRDAEYSKHRP